MRVFIMRESARTKYEKSVFIFVNVHAMEVQWKMPRSDFVSVCPHMLKMILTHTF